MFRRRREAPSSTEERTPRTTTADATADLDDEIARLRAELNGVTGELDEVRRSLAEAEEHRRAAMRGVVTEISSIVEQMETEFERALSAITCDPESSAASAQDDRHRMANDDD